MVEISICERILVCTITRLKHQNPLTLNSKIGPYIKSKNPIFKPSIKTLKSKKCHFAMHRHIKPSSSKNNEEDFISKLPDALLIQILSLLPESHANRTRILSKRWKNLYAFLPNLHFVLPFRSTMKQVTRFYDFIDQTFAIRDNMPIHSFFLDSFKNCESTRLYRCLSTVVQLKVQHLYIRLPDDFYWGLFKTSNTLVEWTLTGGFRLVLPKQASLIFPSLKKLVLINVAYSSEVLTNLISGCPILEELVVERKIFGKYYHSGTYMVCSQSLKRLTICLSSNLIYKVVIDAPKLEYLYISDDTVTTTYVLTETLSLVEAHISYDSRYVGQPLTRLSSAKILTLTNTTIHAFSYYYGYVNLPMLPNLVKLVIGIDCLWRRNLLLELLNTMPNLEHITFSDGISGNRCCLPWNSSLVPPDCLCFKMKEIAIHNGETVRQEELAFIRYLLKHSYKLEKLTIIAHDIDPKKQEQLLNFSRGSMCQIELV